MYTGKWVQGKWVGCVLSERGVMRSGTPFPVFFILLWGVSIEPLRN